MKLLRIRAVARKEFIHVFRDARSLGMAIVIPMIMLLLFGYALTLDVDKVPLTVWDRSSSAASRDFTARFSGSRYFSISGSAASMAEIERALDARKALLGLVIPEHFDRRLSAGTPVPVQLVVDGSDANTATIAIGYAEAIAMAYSQQVTLARLSRRTGARQQIPLELRTRVWFNHDLQSRNFIIPGLIAIIMMVIAALLTSLTVAREWESGTMEQLIATPVTSGELILGKLAPYFTIGIIDVTIAVLMGEFLFDVPLNGNTGLLFAMAAVFLVGTLAMGIMISIIARNQLVASQFAIATTFLPAFLLSGFVFSISNMPAALQVVSHIVPARYFITLLKGIYLKGIGLEVLALEAILLAVYGGIVFAVANARFTKKL